MKSKLKLLNYIILPVIAAVEITAICIKAVLSFGVNYEGIVLCAMADVLCGYVAYKGVRGLKLAIRKE